MPAVLYPIAFVLTVLWKLSQFVCLVSMVLKLHIHVDCQQHVAIWSVAMHQLRGSCLCLCCNGLELRTATGVELPQANFYAPYAAGCA
eukprot:6486946-Amphidinium_carterae.1